ncbi:heterogeneous nuclear ribonucleoproteins A2/B1 isoform X2 [Hypomesus transpacificus]|uniref:heterogeneous nuclear ribonucleoproteins A2/B1 isoform X2 n=1 Tax=Hypomesus transpacificus TaxID=137520 RepID=UPI001F0826E5|nr:heterogeneous nuclear ribonucleoproteins A2/B1 isoform X2 [Hypomesus transpacificus]
MLTAFIMEPATSPKKVFICFPKENLRRFAEIYELDHGLVVKNLNPYINEGYLQAYFREWGNITLCTIHKDNSSGSPQGLGYVRFSSEAEADMADWVGPHYIGGTEVATRRVYTPKRKDEPTSEQTTIISKQRPRRSMGLGYLLEDAQWLDDEEEK